MNRKMAFSAFSIALLLAAGTVFTSCESKEKEIPENMTETESADTADSSVEETEAEDDTDYVPPVFVECRNDEIHDGELILVNRDYAYKDSYNMNLVNLYANMTDSYIADRSDMELDKTYVEAINNLLDDFVAATGLNNVVANSGYRSYEEQNEMYLEDLERTGLNYSELVAPPGNSEHHTGLAMDFAVDDGDAYPALRNEGEYSWIYENAHKYGMILRYTEQNKHITKYMAESWHFRYIGPVHASIVRTMGISYEEYIGFLKDFQFDNPLEYKFSDTEFYRIYYVPVNTEGNITEIPLPYEAVGNSDGSWSYKISGNNADGFIVTVKIPELSENYDDTYLYMFNPLPDTAYNSDYTDSDSESESDEDTDDSEDNLTDDQDSEEESGW